MVVGDTTLCPQDLAAVVGGNGGDYLLVAKDNHPSLVIDIQAGFAFETAPRLITAAASRGTAGSSGGGGGRPRS